MRCTLRARRARRSASAWRRCAERASAFAAAAHRSASLLAWHLFVCSPPQIFKFHIRDQIYIGCPVQKELHKLAAKDRTKQARGSGPDQRALCNKDGRQRRVGPLEQGQGEQPIGAGASSQAGFVRAAEQQQRRRRQTRMCVAAVPLATRSGVVPPHRAQQQAPFLHPSKHTVHHQLCVDGHHGQCVARGGRVASDGAR